jgi:hypothetical protein
MGQNIPMSTSYQQVGQQPIYNPNLQQQVPLSEVPLQQQQGISQGLQHDIGKNPLQKDKDWK